MSEDDLQAGGESYVGVLDAVAESLDELIPMGADAAHKLAPMLVAGLARRGYLVDRTAITPRGISGD